MLTNERISDLIHDNGLGGSAASIRGARMLSREIEAEVRAEAQEPAACTYCDGTGDVHSRDSEWRGECNCGAAQYNMIDRLLRNTFDDEDYAVYSTALNVVAAPQPPAPCPTCQQTAEKSLEACGLFQAEIDALQAKVAEQAALIEKCEKALTDNSETWDALDRRKQALAAIAAQKGGAA